MLIHPLFVHFPIALWFTAAFFDVLAWRRPEPVYRLTAFWLIGIGLVGAAASIVFGWTDLLMLERQGVGTGLLIRHRTHSILAYVVTAIYLANLLWRWRLGNRSVRGPLALSLAGAALIVVTGYIGSDMRQVM